MVASNIKTPIQDAYDEYVLKTFAGAKLHPDAEKQIRRAFFAGWVEAKFHETQNQKNYDWQNEIEAFKQGIKDGIW